jgi:hypothetical protein
MEQPTFPVGRRARSAHPEQIPLNDDTLIRNDIVANELGVSERTINRGDAKGAPFVLIGGVKYRPIKDYRQFLADRIQRRGQPPQRRSKSRRKTDAS